jgi:hypothetical protein
VTGDPLLLLLANALSLGVGVGVVLAVGLGDGWRTLATLLGLAYGAGLAIVGILDATFALIGMAVGLPELALLTLGSLLVGLVRRRGRSGPPDRSSVSVPGSWALAAVLGTATALLLGLAGAAFVVKPLVEWDGWAVWGVKAEALYDFGSATGPVFTSPAYAGIQQSYPLFLPALEATDYRAMSAVDGSVVHLQLALFAVAFAGSLFGLLWRRVATELVALTVLAILAAPPVLGLLGSNYADVPLAFLVSLGIVALARWLVDSEPALLVFAALFLGAATLTKDEGSMFATAAFLPALAYVVMRDRPRLPQLLAAAGAVGATLLPWRIFSSVHHLTTGGIQLSGALSPNLLASHAGRVAPSAHALAAQIAVTRWGLLVPLVAVGVLAGLLARRRLAVWFALAWLVLSFCGLLVVYWISSLPLDWYLGTSAYRIVATLVIGGASLTPLLAADVWDELRAGYERKRSATSTLTAPSPSRQVIFLPSSYERP